MRTAVILIQLLIHVSWISGQQPSFQCISDIIHEDELAKNVTYSFSNNSLEKEYVTSTSRKSNNRNLEFYTLPVVVHIIHEGGAENITDVQVESAMGFLNEAFRNVGYYDPNNGEDARISFCLASRDPYNQPTSGITRTFSNLTQLEYETEDASLKTLIRWDSKAFINIWVVKDVCFFGDCRVAGYATSPVMHGFHSDGVVIESSFFGSSPALTTSLIHEMGHYFGLAHTFQGGCENDNCLTDGDKVCDTPPDNATGYFPCNFSYNSCSTDEDDLSPNNPYRPVALGGIGDQPDMFQNYMDYGTSDCFDRFTLGQVERMHFFIAHQRKSLTQALSCFPPCSILPIANFILPINEFLVNDEINLSNNSSNFNSNTWLINDQVYSDAKDTSVSFDAEGVYSLTLVVNSSIQGCGSDTFTQEVIITCPTISNFDYSLSNDSIFLNSNSINPATIDWSVTFNNTIVFTSNEPIDSFYFAESGYYQICLTAHGLTCEDIQCEFVRIYKSGTEDCQNEIDDDGDGMIDQFDNDCDCTDLSYQALCPISCQVIPDSFPDISIKLKWQSAQISDYENLPGNLVCGDIDGDGDVEILSSTFFGQYIPTPPFSSSINGISIISGNDGSLEKSFSFTSNGVRGDPTALAIRKNNSEATSDIYFLDFILNRLVRYDKSGNRKWISSPFNLPYGAAINFADFNADGIVEIYMNNQIFNAETGKLLATGKAGIGGNKSAHVFDNYSYAHSVAADLLPTPGLELAAGNTVYQVILNNLTDSTGNLMVPYIANSPIRDGCTAVADIDGDQQLDLCLARSNDFMDGGGVWVWNPRTLELIAGGPSCGGGSIPAIGDLDGDCIPEIVIACADRLNVYKYKGSFDLELIHSIIVSENSGTPGVALFDLNQDGKNEIIYADQIKLYVINGETGNLLDSYPVFNGTFRHNPIIADIDNDGHAEIVVNGSLTGYDDASVIAFESATTGWAPARAVWNQIGYHVTNVNDDLSIPKEPQNWAKQIPGTSNCSLPTCEGVYNNFMTQATYRTQEGCIQFPAKDIKVGNLSYSCSPDSLTLCFSVENIGNGNFSNEPVFITAWESNPFQTNATQLFVKQVNISLEVGEIDTICLSDLLITGYDSIVLMVNDRGSVISPYLNPANSFDECDYQNNLVSVELNFSPLVLELGPDISKCNSSVVTLIANSGFETYLWNDGNTSEQFSTSIPGLYFVQTTDVCQRIYTDSVRISIEEPTQINLGPDQTICPLETLDFALSNSFDWVHWISTIHIACDTCQSIQIASDTSYLLIALAGNDDCIVQDSVNIEIVETVTTETDQFICSNERFEFFGDSLDVSGTYSHITQDCDSLFVLNLSVGQVTTTDINEVFCDGDSIEIEGQWISKAGSYIIELSDANGCDSLVNLSVTILPEYETFLVETICLGDSLQFGTNWLYEAGTYSTMLLSESGCDSLINLELNVENEVIQEEVYTLCKGDSLYLKDHWVYDSGLYKDTLYQNDCNVIVESTVNFYPYYTFFDTASICGKDSIWVIDQWVITPGLYSKTLSTIFGCDSTLNVNVIEIPDYPLPTIEVDCEHSTVILNIAGDTTLHVSWDNGDNSHSTTYTASDSARWSISYDTICIRVFAIPLPEIPNASIIPVFPDTTISSETFIGFDLGLDPNDWRIIWETDAELSCDSCSSVIISTESNTEVSVQLTHLESGCTFKEGFRIFVSLDGEFYIPNVFSPNGDGVNDIWTIGKSNPNIEFNSLEIFDRWGNQVANWKNTNLIQWDGLMKDKPLQSGVYAFVLKYSNPGHPSELKKGTVTLIR